MLSALLFHLLLSGLEQASHVGEEDDAMVAQRSQVPHDLLEVLLSDVQESVVADYRQIRRPLLRLPRDYLLPQPLQVHRSVQNRQLPALDRLPRLRLRVRSPQIQRVERIQDDVFVVRQGRAIDIRRPNLAKQQLRVRSVHVDKICIDLKLFTALL